MEILKFHGVLHCVLKYYGYCKQSSYILSHLSSKTMSIYLSLKKTKFFESMKKRIIVNKNMLSAISESIKNKDTNSITSKDKNYIIKWSNNL